MSETIVNWTPEAKAVLRAAFPHEEDYFLDGLLNELAETQFTVKGNPDLKALKETHDPIIARAAKRYVSALHKMDYQHGLRLDGKDVDTTLASEEAENALCDLESVIAKALGEEFRAKAL